MVGDCKNEIESQYEKDSFQRIFMEQQIKYNKLKNKNGMRWRPAMIRFCLYIKNKSSVAYSSLRTFINLPCDRTLFDYSHKKMLVFSDTVIAKLITLCEKENVFATDHKTIIGLLQDELKVKADLVYNKHTGDLIGFVNLDNIAHELIELENNNNQSKVAEYMLVLMVRGITTNIKYPLAAFSTKGITADVLYPIIWEGVSILEIHVG